VRLVGARGGRASVSTHNSPGCAVRGKATLPEAPESPVSARLSDITLRPVPPVLGRGTVGPGLLSDYFARTSE
jgi:hypothetical protein